MNDATMEKGPDAAATATGPDVVKAASQTIAISANGQQPPDENLLSDAGAIDGADLLDRALAFIEQFLILPPGHAKTALVLWAAHAHLMGEWETTPRLALLSAEPGSGKSLAMRLVALLCPLALEIAGGTTASLIRALDDPAGRPTYFIDEIDTIYGPRAKGDEDFRRLMNAGHQIDGYILRNEKVGDDWYPVRKNVFAAVAMAGIGDILPDTILTRSIVVKMRKCLPGEKVVSYRRRDHMPLGNALRDELATWADQIRERAALCRPTLPDGIADRDADVWEPLIVVADMAGGSWPEQARQAAIEAMQARRGNSKPSPGVQLLADIRACMGDEIGLPTTDLLTKLLADEEAPWGDLGYHKKLNARILSEMLDEYGIKSKQYRFNGKNKSMQRGYLKEDFSDAWARHLRTSFSSVTAVTAATDQESSDGRDT